MSVAHDGLAGFPYLVPNCEPVGFKKLDGVDARELGWNTLPSGPWLGHIILDLEYHHAAGRIANALFFEHRPFRAVTDGTKSLLFDFPGAARPGDFHRAFRQADGDLVQ